jgi:hypothetical protein
MAIAAFMGPRETWALKGSSFGGHPNFGFWLSSIPSQITGVITLWNIRIAGAIIGSLSILFFSLAVREGIGRGTSLLFLLFALPFHLHVHYSRTAYAYNHALLAAGLFFWLVVRLVKFPTRLNALLAGASVGVCLLVYSAAHVLPIALMGTMVIRYIMPERRLNEPSPVYPKLSRRWPYLLIGFLLIFGLQLHEWITSGYQSRATSQFILSPGSRRHLELSIGHPLTDVQIFVNSFWNTLRFFYLEDSSGQYSFRGAPLNTLASVLACGGLVILLYRAIARDLMSLMVILAAVLTVAGSMLMVEANFSPHLVLFGLFIPLACAIGLESIVRPIAYKHTYLAALVVLPLGCWWAWWNYNYYLDNMARNSRGRHVWLLNLPIDTFSVRSITNFTGLEEPFGESFFELVYPKSKRTTTPASTAAEAFATFTKNRSSDLCPCLLLIDDSQASTFAQMLKESGAPFSPYEGTFYDPNLNSTAFLVP